MTKKQTEVGEGKKELVEKLILYTRRSATQLSYHFDVVNLILRIRSEKYPSCERIQSIPTSVWEKINVFHYLPRLRKADSARMNFGFWILTQVFREVQIIFRICFSDCQLNTHLLMIAMRRHKREFIIDCTSGYKVQNRACIDGLTESTLL